MKQLVILFSLIPCLAYSKGTIRLAIIDSQKSEPYSSIRTYLYERFKEKGYIKGENLLTQEFAIGNRLGTIKNIWRYFLKDKVDIVYVSGTLATMGAKKYLEDKPVKIVFAAPTDPIGIGVIKNFNQPPYSNFTGISYPVRVANRVRFTKNLIPKLKTIGYIHTDMPQSLSYLNWLKNSLKLKEFRNIKLKLRKVPFIPSEGGHKRMSKLAKKFVLELNDSVDVFLSPNDQMGTQKPFSQMMKAYSKRPLIGIGKKDVDDNWGATASLYPSLKNIATVAADMIIKLSNNVPIKEIWPVQPKEGVAINNDLAKKFKVRIPGKYR